MKSVTMIFKSVLFSCALLNIIQAAYVDKLKKTSLSDDSGLKDLVQGILKEVANGVDEYNVMPIDPAVIKDLKINILNFLDLTIKEGVVTGIKDSDINRIHMDSEGNGEVDFTLDLKVKGTYSAAASNDEIQKLIGASEIHGNGNIDVDVEKLNMKVKFAFEFIKKADGDTYLKINTKDITYEYDIADLKVNVDNLFMGDQDASELVSQYVNKNFEPLVKSYGKNFIDSALLIVYDVLEKLCDAVPTKYYLTDDVTPYIKI